MTKKKKIKIQIYIEKELLKDIQEITEGTYAPLEDISSVVRYCVKQQLPILKKEKDNAEK